MSRCKAFPAYKLKVQVLPQMRHCGGDVAIANTAIGAEGYLLLTRLSCDGHFLDGIKPMEQGNSQSLVREIFRGAVAMTYH